MTETQEGYNAAVVRELLLAAFTAESLRRFCQDRPEFRSVVDEFGPGHGLADMVDELITYCEKRVRFGRLVAEVREANPEQFARFEGRLGLAGTAGNTADGDGMAEEAGRKREAAVPGDNVGQGAPVGCPFVVGRPLRAEERIFGRDELLRAVGADLANFSSVNLVGERRMGKTSVLHHLVYRQIELVPTLVGRPPLFLVYLDCQREVDCREQFYGRALRGLLTRLPSGNYCHGPYLKALRRQLELDPRSDYRTFEDVLKRLCDARGDRVSSVLVVDEFERLLDPADASAFPYPGFFDGLRALMTANLLTMVVASRRPLSEYFSDPDHPQSMTSSFPSYFLKHSLEPLDEGSSDALLLQESDRPLTVAEVTEAKRWARGHPCHLQAAGRAWYLAKGPGQGQAWARQRFEELKGQNCMVPTAAVQVEPAKREVHWPVRGLRMVFREVPMRVGRLAQRLGAHLDDVAAWIIGTIVIVVLVLVLLGVVPWAELWAVVRKGLGVP